MFMSCDLDDSVLRARRRQHLAGLPNAVPDSSAKGDANHIAMVKLGTEFLAEFEPQVVDKIDILRPKPRWVRAEIHKDGRAPGRDDFEGEGMPWFGQSFPGLPNTARKLSESMRAETPLTRRDALRVAAV